MLNLADVHKSYAAGKNRLQVLKGIDLTVDAGELVSIMGSSGSGKSTLLNVLGLLDRHDSGEYRLEGKLIEDLSETAAARLRGRMIGFVFQAYNLIPFKTAVENVALPLYYQRVSRRKRNRLAMEGLERVGLAERAEHLPTEMSGGEQQRVAIARALIASPRLLLADEPTGNMDTANSVDVMRTLQEINRSGVTMVIVTHEPDIAEMTDRTIHLRDGVIESDLLTGRKAQHA